MNSATKYRKARSERIAHIAELDWVDVSKSRGFFRGTAQSIRDFWAHRELLGLLVRREIKARYKGSNLGVVWSLFRPLVQLAIYFFAIGQIMGAARSVPDFAIFVFIGLTLWTLYSEILTVGVRSIVDNSGLVKKVYLPREIFPLAAVGSALVNFVVQLAVLLVGIAILSHYRISIELLYAPLAAITLLVFATAMGIVAAAANVYLRDVQHLIEVYLVAFFWMSPIVYPFTFVHNAVGSGWLEEIYLASPVTISIIAAQKALWASGSANVDGITQYWPPDLELRLLIALLASLVLLWVAQRIFSRVQGNFAQEL